MYFIIMFVFDSVVVTIILVVIGIFIVIVSIVAVIALFSQMILFALFCPNDSVLNLDKIYNKSRIIHRKLSDYLLRMHLRRVI